MRSKLFIASALLAMGCSSPTDTGPVLVEALIYGFDEEDPRVSLELTGSSLSVGVTSYGNGCRTIGELRVSVENDTRHLTVAPFDWENRGVICPDLLRTFQHQETVELAGEGEWTVLVVGRTGGGQVPVQFAYTVNVES